MAGGNRRAAWGAAALIACGQYFVAEAIAASAWRDPAYSYARNYISDLGAAVCVHAGRASACPRLAFVMNAGLILSGVLCIAAAWLLLPSVAVPGRRRLVAGLAGVHGIGSVVVGLVHSTAGSTAATPGFHLAAAYAAILGGDLLLVAAGWMARGGGAPSWYAAGSIGLGLLGLAGGAALVTTNGMPPGLLERVAVYPITIWEVATGLLIVLTPVPATCRAKALRPLHTQSK